MTLTSAAAAAAAPRTAADLQFDQPLPRAVVHKTGIGEVFLTDSVQTAPDLVVVAGELPRSHRSFSDRWGSPRGVELMAALELVRQSAYVIAHRHCGAGLDVKYVLRNLHGTMAPGALELAVTHPTPVVLNCRLVRVFEREGAPCGVCTETEIVACDGPSIGTFGISYSWMPPAVWRRMREGAPRGAGVVPPPRDAPDPRLVPAAAVGRSLAANVVLAGPVARAGKVASGVLLPDPHDAPHSDHAGGHISGMVLAEGWRQLAVWAAAARLGCPASELAVDQLDTTFTSIAEFQGELRCEATLDAATPGRVVARVAGEQDGRALGHATIGLQRAPARRRVGAARG